MGYFLIRHEHRQRMIGSHILSIGTVDLNILLSLHIITKNQNKNIAYLIFPFIDNIMKYLYFLASFDQFGSQTQKEKKGSKYQKLALFTYYIEYIR